MQLRVSYQARDIMVLQQCVCEDLGRSESGCVQSNAWTSGQWTYGNSAIDDAQSEICSRCASKRVMLDSVQNVGRARRGRKQWRPRCSTPMFRAGVSEVAGAPISATHQHHLSPTTYYPPSPTRTFRLSAYIPRATIMADSMEGVVTDSEQPQTENVEQKAIAGK